MRIRILPPSAEVKVSAPLRANQETIKKFIIQKIEWIKLNRQKILSQKFEAPKKFLDGEFHEFFGEKFLLKISKDAARPRLLFKDQAFALQSKKHLNFEQRKKLFDTFYRKELKKIVPSFIENLEKKMHVKVQEFGVKKMKTRWGTCNAKARRIWINLELAKKPLACLEYLIAHEMIHFFESNHNKKFFAHLDFFLPNWRDEEKKLRESAIR